MPPTFSAVEDHYHRPGLYEAILEQLAAQGISPEAITRRHIAAVDEFHVRGAEVSHELAAQLDLKGKRLLDVGCGIGGPCRMLAEDFGGSVTGIDLNGEFIRTAGLLSELLQLDQQTDFIQANALDLPFPDGSFDVVWTQHVQMNILDKERFYGEIVRMLPAGGTFLYYDIFKLGPEPITFPVPWAGTARISHLVPHAKAEAILTDLGMEKLHGTDETEAGIRFFEKVLERVRTAGLPPVGLQLLMGPSTPEKLGNLLAALKAGQLELKSGVYRKIN